jgi:hypothetical protein
MNLIAWNANMVCNIVKFSFEVFLEPVVIFFPIHLIWSGVKSTNTRPTKNNVILKIINSISN